MNASHTPGPWQVDGHRGYGGHDGVRVSEPRGYVLAVAISDVPELHAEANARLIAAAPDLLGALSDLYAAGSDASSEAWDGARAAILKATGAE